MSGFTKLVPEIVQSSIWNESPEVRCVWIAMIATKDGSGNVRGNPQSLARLANVPIDAVMEALGKFQSPDAYSNTPDNDGRRIESVPGGWHVINHDRYRAKDYREHEAERKQEYRRKKEMSGTCPGQVTDSSVSDSVSASVSLEEGCKGETGKPSKKPYGEFGKVRLTDEEHAKLAESYGDRLAEAIGILDTYLASKGKRYSSHYAVMKRGGWVWEKSGAGAVDMPEGVAAFTLTTNEGPLEVTQPKIDAWKAEFGKCSVMGTLKECEAVLRENPKSKRDTLVYVVRQFIYWQNKD